MIEEIICKFWNKKHNIGVVENGKYFAKLPNGRIVDCVKIVHCGSIHYRPKTTSRKISAKQLNVKADIIENHKIQEYCPF